MIRKVADVNLPLVHYKLGDDWTKWAQELYIALRSIFYEVVSQLNSQSQGLGVAIASATVIKPTSAIHHVSGTTAIQTITIPSTFPAASLTLIPDGAWTLTTGGNIGKASTAVVGVAMRVTYDGTLWYPSY